MVGVIYYEGATLIVAKIFKIAVPVLFVFIVVVAWLAPIGPLPGFFIGGAAANAPASWADTSETDEITFEVQGGIPRVVTIWVVQVDGELHVVGSRESGWVQKLGQGGPVRLRLDGNTYSLTASLLNEGWEPALEAYVNKYRPNYPDIVNSFPPLEEAAAASAVFRLRR
jgi:hypothetical protein